ncbi:hypothetical protein [Aquimarina algiphila]|uniref:Uncharacterized protein n=1 Tax=Aquimarina algiphila TaxID=2047982 RepID=A0A554VEI4_9FLAO|nr:hypothetical protein [Aquimarina algiphila]TSE05461.1 hypothetical protein FOF46_22590 [Aquimarina algiphila]
MKKVNEIKREIPLIIDKIDNICKQYELTSDELILELVRFLDLIHITDQKLSPSYLVNLVWHEFILFTRFYEQFCLKHYTRFIHHTPGKREDANVFKRTIKLYITRCAFRKSCANC